MRTSKPPALMSPISTAWNTVARFDDYETAQRAVDHLSDDGFPVEKLDIVGSDLRLIERVTGRITNGRAAAAGALSGMWMGPGRTLSITGFGPSGSPPGRNLVTELRLGVTIPLPRADHRRTRLRASRGTAHPAR